MTMIITTTGRDYWIRLPRESDYDQDPKLNTIPTCQYSAIISQRRYNGRNESPAMTTIIMNTGFVPIKEISRIPFLQVNWVQLSLRQPTINGAILPLNRQNQDPKAKLKDDCMSAQLRQHPFEMSQVHRLHLACTPPTVATSKNFGEQQQQRELE